MDVHEQGDDGGAVVLGSGECGRLRPVAVDAHQARKAPDRFPVQRAQARHLFGRLDPHRLVGRGQALAQSAALGAGGAAASDGQKKRGDDQDHGTRRLGHRGSLPRPPRSVPPREMMDPALAGLGSPPFVAHPHLFE